MASQYETNELSARTWPDFQALFSRGNGWDFCWCTAFERGPRASRTRFATRAEVSVQNERAKEELVKQHRARGILVYANGEPIGWCQYGSGDELLGRGPTKPHADQPDRPLWRVTCFVVDRRHRRRGVASLALRAALDSIRIQGGGLVEAYPVACWTHGPTRATDAAFVDGVGPVAPAWGGFGNVSTSGIVSTFKKEGFEAVAVCGSASARVRAYGAAGDHVVMRKIV
jgi:ribosomal protein S18 acetylase RimI-like enzyme